MRVTLTHIGAIALGRLLATWSFVLGVLALFVMSVLLLISMLFGLVVSDSPAEIFGGGLIGLIMFFIFGVIGLVVNSILAFIFGVVAATIYNIILGIGGGVDFDFRERT